MIEDEFGFDLLYSQKNLFNEIEKLVLYDDRGFFEDEYKKWIKKKFMKIKKRYLPEWVLEKVKIAVVDELNLLFDAIAGYENKNAKAISYFKGHKEKFNVLELNDVKSIEFERGDNVPRQVRRTLSQRIAEKMHFHVNKCHIPKMLGLET